MLHVTWTSLTVTSIHILPAVFIIFKVCNSVGFSKIAGVARYWNWEHVYISIGEARYNACPLVVEAVSERRHRSRWQHWILRHVSLMTTTQWHLSVNIKPNWKRVVYVYNGKYINLFNVSRNRCGTMLLTGVYRDILWCGLCV